MRSQCRAGFTLIEMMVALALTMFLMVIMTQCFILSMDTFVGLKAIGDMQQGLRSACTILQSDLAADHFEARRRLSDPNIADPRFPIQNGYFAIKQGSASVSEGVDAFGVPSWYSTNHALAMTVKQRGNRPENFYSVAMHDPTGGNLLTQFFYPTGSNRLSTATGMLSAPNSPQVGGSVPGYPPIVLPKNYVAPPSFNTPTPDLPSSTYAMPYTGGNVGFYSSQWAEVYYFLVRTGSTEEPFNPNSTLGTPTYSLYRAQFVMVPDSTNLTTVATNPVNPILYNGASVATFQGMSCNPDPTKTTLVFNSPADVAAYNYGGTLAKVRRAVDISGAGYFPITPADFAAADPRFVPSFAPYNGGGTGQSEGNGQQTQGIIELVVPNVISFNIQTLPNTPTWQADATYTIGSVVMFQGAAFQSVVKNNIGQQPTLYPASWIAAAFAANTFVDLPNGGTFGMYYDTSVMNSSAAMASVPAAAQPVYTNAFGLKAIRVTLRVWDFSTRQTRQASVVQDM